MNNSVELFLQQGSFRLNLSREFLTRVRNPFREKYGSMAMLKISLKRQSQQLSSALSSAGYFKSHCCKQCGPRSDCSFRSSLIWVHTVCLYAKCKFEKFARRCSRRHKQTTFSDADFLGALRVNFNTYIPVVFLRSLFL